MKVLDRYSLLKKITTTIMAGISYLCPFLGYKMVGITLYKTIIHKMVVTNDWLRMPINNNNYTGKHVILATKNMGW